MKHLKKYLSLALALVLCLSLAACGKSSEDYDESNEDYGDDGSDYNLYGVPDSFEGLVKDSEQMANLYLYGGAWTGEDGGTLVAANNDEGDEVRFALYDADEDMTASGFIQFVPDYDYHSFRLTCDTCRAGSSLSPYRGRSPGSHFPAPPDGALPSSLDLQAAGKCGR